MKIDIDTHIHTELSKCCQDPGRTPESVADELSQRGFRLIAITDHFWDNPAYPPNQWLIKHPRGPAEVQAKHIRNAHFPIRVLASCEADMQGVGRIGITPESKAVFDFVSVAADHFQLRDFVDQPNPPTPENMARLMIDMHLDAVRSGLADVLLHPMFASSYDSIYDKTMECISDAELFDVLAETAAHDVVMEINCGLLKGCDTGRFSMDTLIRLFETAKKAGCKFTIGSDSHCPAHFQLYGLAEDFTNRIGLTEDDIHPRFRG